MNLLATPLSSAAFLHVHGAETDVFLQGQLSSDLRRLAPERAQISSYNTAKGRILALPHLLRAADGGVLMELPAELAEATAKRLRMFVLRAKVIIDLPGERLQGLGLLGADAADWLRSQQLPVPEAPLDVAQLPDHGLLILRRLGEPARYSLIAAPETLATLRTKLPADCAIGDVTDWRRADIDAGMPAVYAATRELFIPQMVNLDLLGGIGFDKGCYTGQEIVARLHYLGQLKRRMFTVEIAGPAPAPGASLVTADERAAGEIVDAVDAGDGHARATAVIQLGHLDDTLQVKNDASRVRILSGPRD